MIKKLVIENFKSLEKIELELDKFNVLIGPNSSGKSNILQAISFLSEMLELSIDNLVRKYAGSYSDMVYKQEIWRNIKINIEAENFEYGVEIKGEKGFAGIAKEILRSGEKEIIREHQNIKVPKDISLDSKSESIFFRNNFYLVERFGIKEIREYLSNWIIYDFRPEVMKKEQQKSKIDIVDKEGANVFWVLQRLLNERRNLYLNIEKMAKEFDNFEQIGIEDLPGDKIIGFLAKNGKKYYSYTLSDGFLKTLALFTSIIDNKKPKVLIYEEPENFIYPNALEVVADLFKISESQVIVATHSPILLNFLKPEEVNIIVVEKKEGKTSTIKIKSKQLLKEKLIDLGMGLGDYWLTEEFKDEKSINS